VTAVLLAAGAPNTYTHTRARGEGSTPGKHAKPAFPAPSSLEEAELLASPVCHADDTDLADFGSELWAVLSAWDGMAGRYVWVQDFLLQPDPARPPNPTPTPPHSRQTAPRSSRPDPDPRNERSPAASDAASRDDPNDPRTAPDPEPQLVLAREWQLVFFHA